MRARLEGLPVRELPGGLRVARAESLAARLRGLARLDRPAPDLALALPRCRSVHTLGMRFALDLIWLDAGGEVVRVDRAVPPARMKACRGARSVVETVAGRADAFLAAGL
jgi:hypothetical protein